MGEGCRNDSFPRSSDESARLRVELAERKVHVKTLGEQLDAREAVMLSRERSRVDHEAALTVREQEPLLNLD